MKVHFNNKKNKGEICGFSSFNHILLGVFDVSYASQYCI